MPDPQDPYDIFQSIVSGSPKTADQQRALAQSLRSQNIMGNLGLASGDRVAAPFGRSLIDQSDTGLKDIETQRNQDLQRESNELYRQQMIGIYGDRMKNAKDIATGHDTNAANIATGHDQTSIERAKIAANARQFLSGSQYQNDPEVMAVVASHQRIFGEPPRGNKSVMLAGIRSMLDSAPEDATPDDIAKQIGGAYDYNMGERSRQRRGGTVSYNVDEGAQRIQQLYPQIMNDLKGLENTPIKGINWFMNAAKDQLNSPYLSQLQTDLMNFQKAYNMVSQRGGSSLAERLLDYNNLHEYKDLSSMGAALSRYADEAYQIQKINKQMRNPQILEGNPALQPPNPNAPAPGPQTHVAPPGGAPPPQPQAGALPNALRGVGGAQPPGGAPQGLPMAAGRPMGGQQLQPQAQPQPQGGAQPTQPAPQTQAPRPQGAAQPQIQSAQTGAPSPAVVQDVVRRLGLPPDLKAAPDSVLQGAIQRLGKFTGTPDAERNEAVKAVFMQVQAEVQRRAQAKGAVDQQAQQFNKPGTKSASDYIREVQ